MDQPKRVEAYTSSTSFAFLEYFLNPEQNFIDWFNDFFLIQLNMQFFQNIIYQSTQIL